jgi:putative resolvase
MKLSQYAKQQGVSHKTAWCWYKASQLDAYQAPTGTMIVRDALQQKSHMGRVALYAWVSFLDQAEKIKQCVESVMHEEEE